MNFTQTVEAARRTWMDENPVEEGVDHVTPFDRFLYGDPPPRLSRLAASQIRHLSHEWANAAALAAACSPVRWREKKQRAERRDAARDRLRAFVASLTQGVQG